MVLKNLLIIIVVIVVLLLYIRYIEKRSIFFPMKRIETTPEAIGLSFEDIYFKTDDDLKINAWFIPVNDARYTLLFAHGNAGNISHRLEKIQMLNNLGLNIFIFDYRGYGRSQGLPNENGLYEDIEAAYLYLVDNRNIPPENIILYGESIGAAAAIDLASKREVGAIITEEAFTSVKDMVRDIYPFLPHFILKSKFDSVSKIQRIKAPKLIIHSIDDEIVPFRQGERLFQAASKPKTFLKIRGGHNTAFIDSQEPFLSGIKSFISNID